MNCFRADSGSVSKNASYILPFAAGQFLYLTLGCLLPKLFSQAGSHNHGDFGNLQMSPAPVDLESTKESKNESASNDHKLKKLTRKDMLINSAMVCLGVGLMALTILMPHQHAHGEEGGDDHAGHNH